MQNSAESKDIIVKNTKLTVYKDGRIFVHGRKNGDGRRIKGKFAKQSPNKSKKRLYYQLGWSVNGKPMKFLAHRIIAQAFLPNWDESLCVDHIDGDSLNNDPLNLRMVTLHENNMAFKKRIAGAKNKYRGVRWVERYKGYVARIKKNQKDIHIGYFKDEEEAAKAWDEKAIELGFFNEALNFPS
jgi:hypothetical protein